MTEGATSAEIEVKIGVVSVRVSGDSDFVERNVNKMLQEALSKTPTLFENATVASSQEGAHSIDAGTNKYIDAGLYSVDPENGKISLHSQVPGNAKSHQMKNIGLILAYATGDDKLISSSLIREACRRQGCLDEKNFASTFKKDFSNFICEDNGKSWELRLTVKGKELAQSVLDKMLKKESK